MDAGASKVVIGTKASPEFLAQLPRDRVVVALDARHGEVCPGASAKWGVTRNTRAGGGGDWR